MNWSRPNSAQHDYHVMEFYIHSALVLQRARYLTRHKPDFDIDLERREGWAYDHNH